MKMIYISCNVSTTQIIADILEASGVSEYQITDNVASRIFTGKHRMNTAVWPGYNNIILTQISEERKASEIISRLKQYNSSVQNTDELISVCSWTIDDYFND